jgi:hypothetical protein
MRLSVEIPTAKTVERDLDFPIFRKEEANWENGHSAAYHRVSPNGTLTTIRESLAANGAREYSIYDGPFNLRTELHQVLFKQESTREEFEGVQERSYHLARDI